MLCLQCSWSSNRSKLIFLFYEKHCLVSGWENRVHQWHEKKNPHIHTRPTSIPFLSVSQPLYDGCLRSVCGGVNAPSLAPCLRPARALFVRQSLRLNCTQPRGLKRITPGGVWEEGRGVGWLVADQAGDLWECPLAPFLGESVGKVAESWHAMTRPDLVTGCQANVKHMVVIQRLGRKLKVHTELRTALELPLLPLAAAQWSRWSFTQGTRYRWAKPYCL